MGFFSILLVVLGVAAGLFFLGIVFTIVSELLGDWLEDRRRRQIQAERIMAEARIQMHTAQAAQAMLEVARNTLARQQQYSQQSWQPVVRVEQVDGHDVWKPHG